MIEFIELASKVYAQKCDNDEVDKRVKGINKYIKDRVLSFEHYIDALLLNQTIRATKKRFKGDHHTIYTQEVNKIALPRKDDKRLQAFDKVTTYSYGTSPIKVCELDILVNEKAKRLLCTIDQ